MHDVLNSTCCHSVTQTSSTLCNPVDCSTPGFLVLCHLSEFDQTHVCWNDRAIQPSHPLSSPSSPAFKLSQHRGLFAKSTLLTEAEYIKKRWQEYTETLYQKKKKKLNDLSILPCAKVWKFTNFVLMMLLPLTASGNDAFYCQCGIFKTCLRIST